jgi:hypothetical protein
MVPRMSRSALLACAATLVVTGMLAGCGPKVPQHPGYKSKKAQPWAKAKPIAWKNGEGEVEGDLDYAAYRRAKWWAVDLPADGELTVTLAQHGGEKKVDVALEVLDGTTFQVITKADREEEDAFEEEKSRTLYELRAGRYLVHLYLQGRLDTAEYELKTKFAAKPVTSSGGGAELAAQLAFPPDLPLVPLDDDTPAVARKRPTGGGTPRPREPEAEKPVMAAAVTGRIINVAVVDGGVEITINRGTDQGLANDAKGTVAGVKNGTVTLKNCGARSCRAFVRATPDQVSGKTVTIGP